MSFSHGQNHCQWVSIGSVPFLSYLIHCKRHNIILSLHIAVQFPFTEKHHHIPLLSQSISLILLIQCSVAWFSQVTDSHSLELCFSISAILRGVDFNMLAGNSGNSLKVAKVERHWSRGTACHGFLFPLALRFLHCPDSSDQSSVCLPKEVFLDLLALLLLFPSRKAGFSDVFHYSNCAIKFQRCLQCMPRCSSKSL